jgi:hypothetical protein
MIHWLRIVAAPLLVVLLVACGPGGGPGPGNGADPDPLVNPLAFVGDDHNEYLSCLADATPVAGNDLFAALVACGFEAPAAFTLEELRAEFRTFAPKLPEWIEWLISSPFNPNPGMLTGGGFTVDEAKILAELGEILDQGDGPPANAAAVAEGLADLAALEQQALASLGDAETPTAQGVLAGLSIARASLAYWSDIWLDGDAPTPAASGPKWWQVVAADVAGGIVGGIFGGGVGAVGLGTAASNIVGNLATGDGGGLSDPGAGIGEAHNTLLACLREQPPLANSFDLMVDVCPLLGAEGENLQDFEREFDRKFGSADEIVLHWIEEWSEQFADDTYSDAQRRYLLELGEIINALDEDADFDRALFGLRLLEMRARADLVAVEDGPVLMGLNIAVSSFSYWQDADFVAPAAGPPKWWQVTLADVAGGVVGGIFGGGVGAVGLGTVASRLVGELGGGEAP